MYVQSVTDELIDKGIFTILYYDDEGNSDSCRSPDVTDDDCSGRGRHYVTASDKPVRSICLFVTINNMLVSSTDVLTHLSAVNSH